MIKVYTWGAGLLIASLADLFWLLHQDSQRGGRHLSCAMASTAVRGGSGGPTCVYSCAQNTVAERGKGSILEREVHICSALPSNRRPHPSANKVSPAGKDSSA